MTTVIAVTRETGVKEVEGEKGMKPKYVDMIGGPIKNYGIYFFRDEGGYLCRFLARVYRRPVSSRKRRRECRA